MTKRDGEYESGEEKRNEECDKLNGTLLRIIMPHVSLKYNLRTELSIVRLKDTVK